MEHSSKAAALAILHCHNHQLQVLPAHLALKKHRFLRG